MNKIIYVFLIFITFVFASCSTKPKVTEDIYNMRVFAERGLDSANKEIAQGNFKSANSLLSEYKRMAILADDPSLIARVCLSYGNALFYTGAIDEAFAEWEEAAVEAQRAKNSELFSVSKAFMAKGNLMSGRLGAQEVLNEINKESANIKNDAFFIAYTWQVKGLALRALQRYKEAEDAMRQSLAIHERQKSLENCSFDWYTIASIRSLNERYDDSITALEKAIEIDRRIENSWGLAASYRAMGDVYRKDRKEDKALEAYNRAKNIYTALKNDDEVKEIEGIIRNK